MSNSHRFRMAERSASNPLKSLERVKGIEPSSSAWKAVALPLSYTRTRGSAQPSAISRRDFLITGL